VWAARAAGGARADRRPVRPAGTAPAGAELPAWAAGQRGPQERMAAGRARRRAHPSTGCGVAVRSYLAWPPPCGCPARCWPCSTSAWTLPGATSWSWSAPGAGWLSPTRGCAGPAPSSWRPGGRSERLPADPDGAFRLTGEEADAHRTGFEVVSAAVAAGDATEFGRTDVVDQAAVLEAVGRWAATGRPVEPPRRQPDRVRRRSTTPNPWPVRRTQTRGGYSVRAKRATARPSRTRQVAATTATWSGTGTCQPPQVMPGSKVARAAGLRSRWSNTVERTGSTA
jgi:hypothetical protein